MKNIIALATASAAFALAAPAFADTKAGLPADQVGAATQAAIAAQPGNVKDVEVQDRRNNQSPVVEVEIIGADGKKHEVKIDSATRAIVK